VPFVVDFDTARFYAVLLDGARADFNRLIADHAGEIPYYFTLQTASFGSYVVATMNTDQSLLDEAHREQIRLRDKQSLEMPLDDLKVSLRYRATHYHERRHLEPANDMLHQFYAQQTLALSKHPPQMGFQRLEDYISLVFDAHGVVWDQVVNAYTQVLHDLAREGLFQRDRRENSVVLDIFWTEGGASGIGEPLNDAETFARYQAALRAAKDRAGTKPI
jgi:hypothetical protein